MATATEAPSAGRTAWFPSILSEPRRRWFILGTIGIAQLMVVLDNSIVNIALPTAQRALGFSDGGRQWVITAYALAFGSLLLLGGRLSDRYGRKVVFMTGLVGFAAASALGGAATSFAMLVGARAVQGAFGALLAPSALSLLTTTFSEGRDRGRAFGVFGAIAGAGGAVGLLLGGVLTQLVSWRWCLYVNLVFAVIALLGAALLLGRHPPRERPSLDLPSALTASTALFCLVFGFGTAETRGFAVPESWGLLVAGALGVVLFLVLQARVTHPLLPLRILRDRDRGGSLLAILLLFVGMFGVFLFLTFYLQQNLHFSPLAAGIAFLPMVACVMTAATTSTSLLLPRTGPKFLIAAGMAMGSAALFWLSTLTVSSTYPGHVLPALLVIGLGMGTAIAPSINTATRAVRAEDAGVASATVNTMQQIGGSVGTALLASVAGAAASSYLSERPRGGAVVAEAAVHSYTTAFLWAAVIFLIGSVLCGTILRPGRPASAAVVATGRPARVPEPDESAN